MSSRGLSAAIARWRDDPNPIWLRELRQSVRLQRTPIFLALLTGFVALLIASVGGIASASFAPAKIGSALFHTFFSLAFAVVAWVGPAVAASTIASERSGRTWEAVLLTGMPLARIARGKFLAALTYISLYVVMLAPVGAVPFLFGGVTATEVFAAFAWLFVFCTLSVAFGLAVSSKFSSAALAIIVTLLVATPVAIVTYILGWVLSAVAHDVWPAVATGPVWLPTAYARASFGWEYAVFLIVAPLVVTLLPTWLLYEITLANLASPSDDRSSGVRRWFLVALPVVSALGIATIVTLSDVHWSIATQIVVFVFLILAALIFANEPFGPSRRVRLHWERSGASAITRYLGPGLFRAMSLLVALGLAFTALTAAAGAYVASRHSSWHAPEVEQIAAVAGYTMAYFVFVSGFIAWTRARAVTVVVPRLLALGMLFVTGVGPWIVMAIAGAIGSTHTSAIVLASPSPFYVYTMVEALEPGSLLDSRVLLAGAGCAAFWALMGTALHGSSAMRVRAALRAELDAEAQFDAVIAQEPQTDEPAPNAARSDS